MTNPQASAIRTALKSHVLTKAQKFSVRYSDGEVLVMWGGGVTPSVAATALMPDGLLAHNVVFVHNDRNHSCSNIRRWYV